jgi:hypothetical protein
MATDTHEETSELSALRAQCEAMHRELVRKSYRIGELEAAVHETAQGFEESLSWRLTGPIRSLRARLGKFIPG